MDEPESALERTSWPPLAMTVFRLACSAAGAGLALVLMLLTRTVHPPAGVPHPVDMPAIAKALVVAPRVPGGSSRAERDWRGACAICYGHPPS